MTKLKYFFVNGRKFCTHYNITPLLVLEYNNLVCYKENWDTIFIQDNDKIEIVTIVGGG
jgi:thiamine biosynthesis protein ThiS